MAYDYESSRQASLKKARSVTAARQRFLDQIYAKMEAEEAARAAEEQKAEAEKNLNWFDDAGKGAQIGSMAGPWGTLIGAAVGTMYGQVKAIKERQKQGQNGWQAFGNTIGDTPFGVNVGAATIPGAGNGKWSAGSVFAPVNAYQQRDSFQGEGYGSVMQGNTAENLGGAAARTKGDIEVQQARTSAARDEQNSQRLGYETMESSGEVAGMRPAPRMGADQPYQNTGYAAQPAYYDSNDPYRRR